MAESKAEVKQDEINLVLIENRVEGLTMVFLYKDGTAKQSPATAALMASVSASSVTVTEVVDFTKSDV